MKKLLLIALPLLLSGCSVYNQLVERMQTDTLEYRCDEKPLTVKLNNPRQEASFVYDNKLLNLKQGMSASGARIPTVSMYSGQRRQCNGLQTRPHCAEQLPQNPKR
jgi:membrane-bound inhibitor of C-type lysozyme